MLVGAAACVLGSYTCGHEGDWKSRTEGFGCKDLAAGMQQYTRLVYEPDAEGTFKDINYI